MQMNKSTLIETVAQAASLKKKDAEAAVNAVFDTLTSELAKGEKIQLAGFGTFKVKERSERVGRNPKTRQEIKIPASKAPASQVRLSRTPSTNKIFQGRCFCSLCGWTSF